MVLAVAALFAGAAFAGERGTQVSNRPRIFISTDLRLSSEEKDDSQSLIHALMYQDKMDIVGIAGTASVHGHQNGRVQDIDTIIDIYGQDLAKLQAHASGFKSVAELKAISWQGALKTAPSAGYSTATDSSKAIIAEAKEAAAAGEKLNVLTWGGETDLAQALHDDPSIAPHIRFFNIHNQDPNAKKYIMSNFKTKFDMWVDDMSTFRGIYQTPTSTGVIKGWHEVNAKGHGALGDYFSKLSGDIFNQSGVKMGDSPTVLRFLNGDQNNPGAESWGGEFVKVGTAGNYWTDNPDPSLDLNRARTNGAMTIYEDRKDWLASFAERFDWLKGGTTTPPTDPPTGPTPPADNTIDTITVRVSGDNYKGDPNFVIKVDGKLIDKTNKVRADHDDGEWETFTFRGNFDGPGDQRHKVTITYDNNLWDGTRNLKVGEREGHDRNLYVDQVTFNGEVNDTNATLSSNGTKGYFFEL